MWTSTELKTRRGWRRLASRSFLDNRPSLSLNGGRSSAIMFPTRTYEFKWSTFQVTIAKLLWTASARSIHLGASLAVGLLALALSGCGGKIPATHYYALKLTPPAPAVSDPKTTFVLDIEPFRASESLHDDRIQYYESPTEFGFYEYHRWDP